MKHSWTKPSLSRDFALLSAAVLFLLFLISCWVTYTTYARYSESIAFDLEKEAARTDRALSEQLENADYLLTAMSKQIAIDSDHNLTRLAQILKAFDTRENVYTHFSWIDPKQQLLISSSKGILEKPIDVSDRDYIKKAFADPWKMVISAPIEGRISGRWVIPVAMGLTDYTGKFIGVILISLDINTLTKHIDGLIRRDGVSFAILSTTLSPLTQLSDDKDFAGHALPTDKLAGIDFSANPAGLIVEGSLFWGKGMESYYRVSRDYPYIVLVGYDMRYGTESIHSQIWSRLLQIVIMAVFFVLLLWVIRARMIKPVLDMTAIAAGVARGEVCASMPPSGPVEMEALATQIRRISEYIEENKRIEDELRNKMLMFRKAREEAELDRRNKSEFLAYVCQELRAPANGIIGAAQVMKDQLYGPIENRKYRQYVADIYGAGNVLMDRMQDVLAVSKAEAGYLRLEEKPVDVKAVIDRTLRIMADKTQEKLNARIRLQDPVPHLIADEFRLQQIIMNALLHVLAHMQPAGTPTLETKIVNENKDNEFFAIIVGGGEGIAPEELLALAGRGIVKAPYRPAKVDDLLQEHTDLGLELAKILVALHGGALDISRSAKGDVTIAILFGGNRIRFIES